MSNVDTICETMHKSRVPLSEDQRAILAGCLAVLYNRDAVLDEAIEAVGEIESMSYDGKRGWLIGKLQAVKAINNLKRNK